MHSRERLENPDPFSRSEWALQRLNMVQFSVNQEDKDLYLWTFLNMIAKNSIQIHIFQVCYIYCEIPLKFCKQNKNGIHFFSIRLTSFFVYKCAFSLSNNFRCHWLARLRAELAKNWGQLLWSESLSLGNKRQEPLRCDNNMFALYVLLTRKYVRVVFTSIRPK